METIEIKQNRKRLFPKLVVMAIALIGMTYYIYFSGEFDNNNAFKIVCVFLIALFVYMLYIPTKKFFKNEPVLTFSKSEITINEKAKPISFLWREVVNWKVVKKDEDTYYLMMETMDKKKIINISWLDRGPNEIEELLQTYKQI